MRRHSLQRQHGFTLVEILIALVVLAIGMVGIARLTTSTIRVNTLSTRLVVASALVQDRLEQLKQAGYAGATTGSVTEAYDTIPYYSAYKRVTTVVAHTPATNIKTVTVIVSWQQDRSTLSATTLLAE